MAFVRDFNGSSGFGEMEMANQCISRDIIKKILIKRNHGDIVRTPRIIKKKYTNYRLSKKFEVT